MALIPVTASFS